MEYLKMADVFNRDDMIGLSEKIKSIILSCDSLAYEECDAISHAVEHHDSLVAEVERLRAVIDGLMEEMQDMDMYIQEISERE